MSDLCIVQCLSALANASTSNEDVSKYLCTFPGLIDSLQHFLRHPQPMVKILASKILTNMRSYCRLNKEVALQFRQIMISMVKLLPKDIKSADIQQVLIVCSVIETLSHNGKDRKHLQKLAGDILAVEKLGDMLL